MNDLPNCEGESVARQREAERDTDYVVNPMNTLGRISTATGFTFLALGLISAVAHAVLFGEGPHGFFPTAFMYGFALLGTLSFLLLAGGAALQNRPAFLSTLMGKVHGGAVAVSLSVLTFLLVFR